MVEFWSENSQLYIDATLVTLQMALVSFAGALVIGVLIAVMRVSPITPLARFASAYVTFFRNLPLLVLFFLFFFALPTLDILFVPLVSANIVLATYTGAYVGEAVRSGINAVDKGEVEAARSVGLSFTQVLRYVVISQALRTVVAPIGSLFIANAKNSALAGTIGVPDLTQIANRLSAETAQVFAAFIGSATIYVVLLLIAGYLFGVIEQRVAITR